MNEEKIKELVNQLFSAPCKEGAKRHIVFWYDEDNCYPDVESLKSLLPSDVKVHILTSRNNFLTKKLIEYDDRESHYLIYAPIKKPENRANWLLDSLLYSQEFTPDQILLTANELGIKDESLKRLIKKYYPFFKNKERCAKLKNIASLFTEEILELSIMAVITRQKSHSVEEITKSLLVENVEEKNEYFDEIKKYGLEDRFWHYAENHFGYREERPALKNLFSRIMLTVLADKINDDLPDKWKSYKLSKWNNCVLFIDHWMKDIELAEAFEKLSLRFEEDFDIPQNLRNWDEVKAACVDCDILQLFDREIIRDLLEKILDDVQNYDKFKDIINIRKKTHWYKEFESIYCALFSACDFFLLTDKYEKRINSHTSAKDLINAYAENYYMIDQAYRRFYTAYDRINNIDLKKLMEKVENLYTNSYMKNIGNAWSTLISNELKDNWNIPGILSQQTFYKNVVSELIKKDDRSKVYVIISDGLRFESAEELTSMIKKDEKIKCDVELSFMQGVVPSYTSLGMSCLLPHQNISISPENDTTIDNMGTRETGERDKILKKYNSESKAIRYSDLKELSRDELRELLKTTRITYIYHNEIDAIGDKEATEKKVFDAVSSTERDITDCIKKLVNTVSATNIFITSDHGFLYQRKALSESDKLIKGKYETIKEMKRAIIVDGESIEPPSGTIIIDMKYILGKETTLKTVTPKGMHRFKTAGSGINYVHGGISLQEIVIPLIKFKTHKVSRQKKVEVKLTNTNRKIANNRFTLNFFQTESISDTVLPRVFKISLWDTDENIQVSDEKILVADKETGNAEEREFKIVITLKYMAYDKNKDYYLKMKDDSDAPPELIPFKINIAFANEFGDW